MYYYSVKIIKLPFQGENGEGITIPEALPQARLSQAFSLKSTFSTILFSP